MIWKAKAAAATAAFLLASCACGLKIDAPETFSRRLEEAGFVHRRFAIADFPVHAWWRAGTGKTLTVIIEGDGASWFNPRWPPSDPTPEASQAAALALALPGSVAYLARPCQFEPTGACTLAHWTADRFAPELVAALDQALAALKAESGAHQLRLVGHSGGGVMAVLLAARRDDVTAVLTLMAPLAVSAWTQEMELSPLSGLDPLAEKASPVPAIHLAGGRDRIVPARIVQRYAVAKGGQYREWPEAEHACWPIEGAVALLRELP